MGGRMDMWLAGWPDGWEMNKWIERYWKLMDRGMGDWMCELMDRW